MIKGARSVAIGVANLKEASAFFENVWNLSPVGAQSDAAWFRGTGPYHHIVSLHRTQEPCVINIVFDAADKADVDRLHAAVTDANVGKVEAPGAIAGPGGGYGFGFQDIEGRGVVIVCDVDDWPDLGDMPDRVKKIAHINLNTLDMEPCFAFYTDVLGLRLIDDARFRFLHCDNSDHSSLVLAPGENVTLNHVAFELPDLDSVMRGTGRLRDAGYPVEWGVGRHGPGDNVFAYFAGPEEIPLEYTSEIMQVDDTYVPHGPDYWRYPPGRSDQWGVTNPRSARLNRIQQIFRHDPNGYAVTGKL